jgi:transposase
MLRLPSETRIFMAVAPVDMRRSFDGLCATVMEVLEQNPLEGHLFLFRGKRADRVKALYWDRNGLAIWYKRLEKGKYKWPTREAASVEIFAQELALLLDVPTTRTSIAPRSMMGTRTRSIAEHLLRRQTFYRAQAVGFTEVSSALSVGN